MVGRPQHPLSRASGRLVRSSCLGKLGGNDFCFFLERHRASLRQLGTTTNWRLTLADRMRVAFGDYGRGSLEQRFLALDVGLGPIATWRRFVVPTTTFVFVRNIRCVSRNDLLVRRAIRRLASQVMRWKGFGKHPVDAIGPTTVMLDNLVNNLGHISLLMLMGGLIVGRVTHKRSPCRPLVGRGQEGVQRRHDLSPFADRRGDPFHRTRANVADREDASAARAFPLC